MMNHEIIHAARALRAAQAEEGRAEAALVQANGRASIHELFQAENAHRQAVNRVECAQDELINAVMRALDLHDAPASITDTQELPAVEVGQ